MLDTSYEIGATLRDPLMLDPAFHHTHDYLEWSSFPQGFTVPVAPTGCSLLLHRASWFARLAAEPT